MAEITHFNKTDVTQRTTTSTSAVEVTQYTVAWSDLTTAGFGNGDDVIVIVRYMLSNNSNANKSRSEIRQGSSFAGASALGAFIVEAAASATGREIMFLDRVTLTTNDNFYISLLTDITTAAEVQDYSILFLKLDDLAAGDFRYAEDATGDADVDGSDYDGASVTLPAGGGDDWLIVGCTQWDDGASSQYGHKLNLATVDYMVIKTEGEDPLEDQSMGAVGYLAAAGASDVCKMVYYGAASGTADYNRSAIFALRMEAFVDHAANFNSTDVAITSSPTWTNDAAMQVSLSLTSNGDVGVFAQTILDPGATSQEPQTRIQADGTDIVASLGLVYPEIYDATDLIPKTTFASYADTSGTIAIDLDATDTNITASNLVDHALVAFSMELAAAAGGGVLGGIAGPGGIAGEGGIAGKHGGIAG